MSSAADRAFRVLVLLDPLSFLPLVDRSATSLLADLDLTSLLNAWSVAYVSDLAVSVYDALFVCDQSVVSQSKQGAVTRVYAHSITAVTILR